MDTTKVDNMVRHFRALYRQSHNYDAAMAAATEHYNPTADEFSEVCSMLGTLSGHKRRAQSSTPRLVIPLIAPEVPSYEFAQQVPANLEDRVRWMVLTYDIDKATVKELKARLRDKLEHDKNTDQAVLDVDADMGGLTNPVHWLACDLVKLVVKQSATAKRQEKQEQRKKLTLREFGDSK
ncbi:MAG: hypothetical protein DHS20C16_03340 [Phycisphaerae bacterium]|nr:MAG: hypothetical protein DHS20C16_03340 [Phycisphaerae bacterium]